MTLCGTDLSAAVLLVADIGHNHEGDYHQACRLMAAAQDAGAVPKLQYIAGHRFSLTFKDREDVMDGESLCSTPYIELLDPISDWCPAISIPSGALHSDAYLDAVSALQKPVLLSTGRSTLAEIDHALERLSGAPSVVLMQSTSAYPAPVDDVHVSVLQDWGVDRNDRFFWMFRTPVPESLRRNMVLGFSCHVPYQQGGREACCAAVALGARVIEVGLTGSRSVRKESEAYGGYWYETRAFPDHAWAVTLSELAELRQAIDYTLASLGDPIKRVYACEEQTDERLVYE